MIDEYTFFLVHVAQEFILGPPCTRTTGQPPGDARDGLEGRSRDPFSCGDGLVLEDAGRWGS